MGVAEILARSGADLDQQTKVRPRPPAGARGGRRLTAVLLVAAGLHAAHRRLSLRQRQDGQLPAPERRRGQRQDQGTAPGPAPHRLTPLFARLLLANGLFPAQNGYTPLHQAAQQGNTHVINVLLQHGAQPNATTLVGRRRAPARSPG